MRVCSLSHNCTPLTPPKKKTLTGSATLLLPVWNLEASLAPPQWRAARATLACHPGCTNSFTPIFYSAFHSNLLLLLRLHYHINYRLSHTRWFPLVSHLHQVDNASTSLNYSVDNLNQREPIHILKRTPTFSGSRGSGSVDSRITSSAWHVCLFAASPEKSTTDFYKPARGAFINYMLAASWTEQRYPVKSEMWKELC